MTEPHPSEAQLLDQVAGERLMESTRAIAQWIRLSGEPDELASFRWIQDRLEEYGYRTELVHHRSFISLPEKAFLQVRGGTEKIEGISHAFAVSTGVSGMSARLVDGNDDSADVSGAVVLVDGMASGVSFRKWEARGAVGQVHVHDDHLHETSISPVWGNPSEEGVELMPRTPSMSIRRTDGDALRRRLAEGSVEVTLQTDVLTEWRPIPLLTAELPGAPQTPYVLLTTHVDSWWYGAMDNGSANATTLEAARLLAEHAGELKRGLRLAFWSGHSHGRFAGSAWYADENWLDLYENCVAHVFVDSTGGMNATVVTEAPVMPQTKALGAAAVSTVTGEQFDGKRIGRFADQSFYGVGLNSLFGTLSEQDASTSTGTISFKTGGKRAGGLGWWWHTPEDTVDKVDEELLVRDTRIYVAALHRLLTAPRLPFDYRPAVDEIVETVADRSARAGEHLDLTGLQEDLRNARDAVYSLHEALDGMTDEADHLANSVLMQISRHLVPIAFHERSRFERDMAEPLVPVPALKDLERLGDMAPDDPAAHALATRLHRTCNWIRFEARAAAGAARAAQAQLAAAASRG